MSPSATDGRRIPRVRQRKGKRTREPQQPGGVSSGRLRGHGDAKLLGDMGSGHPRTAPVLIPKGLRAAAVRGPRCALVACSACYFRAICPSVLSSACSACVHDGKRVTLEPHCVRRSGPPQVRFAPAPREAGPNVRGGSLASRHRRTFWAPLPALALAAFLGQGSS